MEKFIPINYLRSVKSSIPFLVLLAALTMVGGCLTFLTEVKVRGDGSGTMVQTITMNPEQMKASMEAIAKQMGADMTESNESSKGEAPKTPEKGPFKENELKEKAVDMGQGVTFVSAETIDTKNAAGVRVTYAFKDINQLTFNPKPEAAMGMAPPGSSSKEALKFHFKRMPNGNSVLVIDLGKDKTEGKEEAAAPPPASPEASAEQTALIREMFKGLHMGVSIEVEGKVVKTNSPYVEGSRVTLMDIDFDPLFADEQGFKALSAKLEKAMGDDRKTMEALKGIKGLKIITDPEVSIEFAPGQVLP